jgi:hypothetical protein
MSILCVLIGYVDVVHCHVYGKPGYFGKRERITTIFDIVVAKRMPGAVGATSFNSCPIPQFLKDMQYRSTVHRLVVLSEEQRIGEPVVQALVEITPNGFT